MSLLDVNDRAGQHPPSWYAATADPGQYGLDELSWDAVAPGGSWDLCVIGAGFTGLSAALHAAERGLSVLVIDAQRVGFGASGRNGGQVGTSFNFDVDAHGKKYGFENTKRLVELAWEAASLCEDMATRHAPAARFRTGIVHADRTLRERAETHHHIRVLQDRFGQTGLQSLDEDAIAALVKSPAYCGGGLDMNAGHLHPLHYAFGLARAARSAGARIVEGVRAHHASSGKVTTDHAEIKARNILIATNGYGTGLHPKLRSRVMPLNNYIVATEPLGARSLTVLGQDVACHDSRFVVNYFRQSHDGRLLFGGGESYGDRFPADIASKVRAPMEQVFPQLKGVKIDYAWGGTLAITMTRLPHIGQLDSGIWSAAGYSGQGVALSGFAGKLIAQTIAGEITELPRLEALSTPRFPGGDRFRSPLMALAMRWYALRDKLGI